jgi:hypothetical protein
VGGVLFKAHRNDADGRSLRNEISTSRAATICASAPISEFD